MDWKFPGFAFQQQNGHTSVFCSKGGLVIKYAENIHMCTMYKTHIIYKPGNPKTASAVFSAHYGDAFCMGPCSLWFFQSIWSWYEFCWTKCWEIVALLWLWRQDRGHTWPYMARHDQFLLVILKVQFLVALDLLPSMTFFWNDQILSHNDHKKGIWSFPVQTYVFL